MKIKLWKLIIPIIIIALLVAGLIIYILSSDKDSKARNSSGANGFQIVESALWSIEIANDYVKNDAETNMYVSSDRNTIILFGIVELNPIHPCFSGPKEYADNFEAIALTSSENKQIVKEPVELTSSDNAYSLSFSSVRDDLEGEIYNEMIFASINGTVFDISLSGPYEDREILHEEIVAIANSAKMIIEPFWTSDAPMKLGDLTVNIQAKYIGYYTNNTNESGKALFTLGRDFPVEEAVDTQLEITWWNPETEADVSELTEDARITGYDSAKSVIDSVCANAISDESKKATYAKTTLGERFNITGDLENTTAYIVTFSIPLSNSTKTYKAEMISFEYNGNIYLMENLYDTYGDKLINDIANSITIESNDTK